MSPEPPSPPLQPPSAFQRRMLWKAITAVSLLAIGAAAVFALRVVTDVLQFLQPVLVPVAFAGILAYLLEPIIRKLNERGTPRFRAMMFRDDRQRWIPQPLLEARSLSAT